MELVLHDSYESHDRDHQDAQQLKSHLKSFESIWTVATTELSIKFQQSVIENGGDYRLRTWNYHRIPDVWGASEQMVLLGKWCAKGCEASDARDTCNQEEASCEETRARWLSSSRACRLVPTAGCMRNARIVLKPDKLSDKWDSKGLNETLEIRFNSRDVRR